MIKKFQKLKFLFRQLYIRILLFFNSYIGRLIFSRIFIAILFFFLLKFLKWVYLIVYILF
jgi:hypothetical protein